MMNHCRDCHYWTTPNDSIEQHTIGETGWGVCQMGRTIDGIPSMSGTKAVALDAELYAARLLTRPDFGCVQFKP